MLSVGEAEKSTFSQFFPRLDEEQLGAMLQQPSQEITTTFAPSYFRNKARSGNFCSDNSTHLLRPAPSTKWWRELSHV
jgi:hypothetical protein